MHGRKNINRIIHLSLKFVHVHVTIFTHSSGRGTEFIICINKTGDGMSKGRKETENRIKNRRERSGSDTEATKTEC